MGIRFTGRWMPVGRLKVAALSRKADFIVQPSILPSGGPMGTLFTGSDGEVRGATIITRQWYLNGNLIFGQTNQTYIGDGIGTLTYVVIARGPNGLIQATSEPVEITATSVEQNAPEFLTSPGLLGTFAEQTSISVPIQVMDVENNAATWEVVGGALPDGVTLNLFNGVIAGQLGEVTADKTFTFKIKVTDRTNLSVEGQFSINVANVKTTVTWETENEEALAMPAPGEPVQIQLGASSI